MKMLFLSISVVNIKEEHEDATPHVETEPEISVVNI